MSQSEDVAISGMKHSKSSFLFGIALSIGYVVIIAYYVINLSNLPDQYRLEESKAVEKIEAEVSKSVDDYALTKENHFGTLAARYPLDLLVIENQKTIYQSSIALDDRNFFDIVSSKAVLYEAKGNLNSHEDDYQFFIRLYNFPDDIYLMPFLAKQIIILSFSFIIITLAFFFIMNSLIQPLKKAKVSLEHLQNYEFDQIKASDDVINQRLSNVSSQIDNAMIQASHRYTDFEKDLEISRQRLNNALVVSRSFVHDLKTPVHQQLMINELVIDNTNPSDTPSSVASMNIKHSTKLMERINEILKVLNQDNLTLEKNISNFDLITLTYTTLRSFGQSFSKKALMIDIDGPESLNIESNKVILQLLIHNLMSNIGHYALPESTVFISIRELSHSVEMIYENESSLKNLDRMKKSEFLFNVLNEDKEHQHSSGNGLFLIKDLANLAHGSYNLKTNNKNVFITITLPKERGEHDEETH